MRLVDLWEFSDAYPAPIRHHLRQVPWNCAHGICCSQRSAAGSRAVLTRGNAKFFEQLIDMCRHARGQIRTAAATGPCLQKSDHEPQSFGHDQSQHNGEGRVDSKFDGLRVRKSQPGFNTAPHVLIPQI